MRTRTAMTVGTAALGLVGLASWLVPAATPASAGTKLTVYEKEGDFSIPVDLGEAGESPGDKILENIPVFDWKTGKQVGESFTDHTTLRTVGDDAVFFVDCQIGVDGGALVFAGGGRLSEFPTGARLPVTGGEGRYRDAASEVVVTTTERDGAPIFRFDFTLTS